MTQPQEIPGKVTFLDGNGDLPKLEISTPWSDAEIYLQGAHVTRFQKKGEPPLLFLSQISRFQSGQAIRGGIPIIFPWFGSREGQPQHGFARNSAWELKEILPSASGEVSFKFILPECPQAGLLPSFAAEYVVFVGKTLSAQFSVTNASADQDLTFEDCLHSYFTVGDIGAVSIIGLEGAEYLDKTENFSRKKQTDEPTRITSETYRIYLGTHSAVEIQDKSLKRRILVQKSGSASTVVWNPWAARAQQMPDFGNDEYLKMVCVESGNVADNKQSLKPGQRSSLKIELSSAPL